MGQRREEKRAEDSSVVLLWYPILTLQVETERRAGCQCSTQKYCIHKWWVSMTMCDNDKSAYCKWSKLDLVTRLPPGQPGNKATSRSTW